MKAIKLSEILRIEKSLSSIKGENLSGKPIYAIAKNLNELGPITTAYNKKRDSLIKEISGGTNQILNTETDKVKQFADAIDQELNTEVEVNLHKFQLKDTEMKGINPSDIATLIQSEVIDVLEE